MVSWDRSIRFLWLISCVFTWSFCQASDVQDNDRFARANDAFLQEKYQEAYKLYQEISRPTPRVYFNMGSCAIKLNKMGTALWHLRQAQERWGFFDYDELSFRLDEVYTKLSSNQPNKKKSAPHVLRHCMRIINAIPLITLQLLFLVCWTLLFVFAKRLLKQKRRTLLILLFISLLVSVGLLLFRQIRSMRLHAIVVEQNATLYAGPSTTYQQVGVLLEGREVFVDKQRQDFCKVRTKGQFGWAARSALGFI